jgi:ribosomal protein L40E
MLATSCPRCGGEAPQGASRCRRCGFAFLEKRERRRRPVRCALVVVALVTLAAGGALLVGRGKPAAAPDSSAPLSAAKAEPRLESQFVNAGYHDTAGVRCGRAVRLAGATRCHVRYTNGDTQLILVGLDGRGALDITIPYPAQRIAGD